MRKQEYSFYILVVLRISEDQAIKAHLIVGFFVFCGISLSPIIKGIIMFNRETLKLINSATGEERELQQCNVGENSIHSKDIKVPVREGDFLIRQLPSGLEEKYQVLDVVAYTNLLPHYELKVKKI